MTRVLIFKEPDAFGVMEVNAPPERIVRAVNQGRWEDYLPETQGPLFARRQADVVVVTQGRLDTEEEAPKLSRREHQVLALLGEGLTTVQIALKLGLSPRTIRGYVAGMKVKMGAHNIQHLVARAVALGLVRPEV
jgi:DNA-binding CsgD family transcriptional regulator